MNIQTDFLVIGSGIAGLSYALKVASYGRVCIVTKKESAESNTNYAQGGIASVVSQEDSFENHIQDTLEAGAGLCHKDVVNMVIQEGPTHVQQLIDWGVSFSQNDRGEFDLGREGGHKQRRIIHAKDMTGKAIEQALLDAIRQHPDIEILENHIAIDLITTAKVNADDASPLRCLGAYVLDRESETIQTYQSNIVLLASGGAGKIYLYTSNPDIATGDGLAMAYRAGAILANLEFVQFHPTCLYHVDAKSFLISEAVRGEGAILRLPNGERFMSQHDTREELAPRDIVARAIDTEMKKGGYNHVLLDLSAKKTSWIKERFPTIYQKCLQHGIDITSQPIPVVPAAHYFCGGVVTDMKARTTIEGLFAAGETACTGLHGANRLASNSLLEALVFSNKAAEESVKQMKSQSNFSASLPEWNAGESTDSDEQVMISHNWDEIRRTMWNYVGIVRSNKRLIRAKRRIDVLREEIKEYYWNFKISADLIELRNIALIASLTIDCALARKESRGLHYNIDYPQTWDEFVNDSKLRKVGSSSPGDHTPRLSQNRT
jgi:L-aspartate oxidase